jgi:hypothetical protein
MLLVCGADSRELLWCREWAAQQGREVRTGLQVPTLTNILPLDEEQILAWADAYHVQHGRWPVVAAGPIQGGNSETWSAVNQALEHGWRGLPGGDSLSRLLARQGQG